MVRPIFAFMVGTLALLGCAGCASELEITESHDLVNDSEAVESHDFSDEVKAVYGVASNTEFVSCIGEDRCSYPNSITGYAAGIAVDLDADGEEEYAAVVCDAEKEILQLLIYDNLEGEPFLACQGEIAALGYCSQQSISLFRDDEAGGYRLLVDAITSGAYTGNDSSLAVVFDVDCGQVEKIAEFERDRWGTRTDDVEQGLLNLGVPFACNSAQIDDKALDLEWVDLLQVEHLVYGGELDGGYEGREHHLQLFTPGGGEDPVGSEQIWTITVESSQGFTEDRNESYTKDLTGVATYEVLPAWKDGEITPYKILQYEVDTQEKTIYMFMDFPEGSPYWESVVLDLANTTYHAEGFAQP